MDLFKKNKTTKEMDSIVIDDENEDLYDEEDEDFPSDEELGISPEEDEINEKQGMNVPTILLIALLVLLVIAIGVGLYNISHTANQETAMQEWVAEYLYEAVSSDGTGLFTEQEIRKISEDVSYIIAEQYPDGLDVENLSDEQISTLVLRIREQLLDSGSSLSTSDVTTISKGVVEQYFKENGYDTTNLTALNSKISDLETADEQLAQSIKNLAATRGATGATGATGAQGPKGDKGDKGDTGAQGATGATGARGPQGVQGVQGERGEQGIQGEQGEQGEQGIQGERGEQGIQGEQGEAGKSAFIVFSEYATGKDAAGNPSFSTAPSSNAKFVGIANVAESTAPEDPSAYTWSQWKENGLIIDRETKTVYFD